MLKILGVDQSLTNCGWSIYIPEYEIDLVGVLKTKRRSVERLADIRNFFKAILIHHKPNYIFMEEYAFGGRGQDMGEVGGILKLLFFDYRIPFCSVSIQHLKKYITGTGAAKKDLMMMKCLKKFNREFTDNNICDAYCLSRYGAEIIKKGIKDFSKSYNINIKQGYERIFT